MTHRDDPQQLVDHLFRREAGRMVAVLTRLFGLPNVETAQDIVQETLLAALGTWKLGALPDNPRAWLYRTAKNRTLDYLRRRRIWQEKIAPQVAQALDDESTAQQRLDKLFLDAEMEDGQLQMLFACCHPALPPEGQIALILKTLCGLSVLEIAAAFLTGKDTIRNASIAPGRKSATSISPWRCRSELSCRHAWSRGVESDLPAVQRGLPLHFERQEVIRRDLCEEALRLADLLARHSVVGLPRPTRCYRCSAFRLRASMPVSMRAGRLCCWNIRIAVNGINR